MRELRFYCVCGKSGPRLILREFRRTPENCLIISAECRLGSAEEYLDLFIWILWSSKRLKTESFFIERASSGLDSAEQCLDLLIRIRSVSSKETKIYSPEERSVEAALVTFFSSLSERELIKIAYSSFAVLRHGRARLPTTWGFKLALPIKKRDICKKIKESPDFEEEFVRGCLEDIVQQRAAAELKAQAEATEAEAQALREEREFELEKITL
ncbi:hypothetical protein AVEN_253735-1 [Araneus ventricosus]|uniref:Uncharacterized protein n=1 Tax=Araneus ventricosus TaxID=182803 RepID=A0A4Y2DW15_ARAVE|nr:hypothetical protein AVEN_253735-1 [Araneus ventricosus]